MKYYTIPPSPKLAGLVRFFWVFESESILHTPYVFRSLADGSAELLFHYKGSFVELSNSANIKQPFSLVHAQSQKFRRFVTTEKFGIFGAYLYPFALPSLFDLPALELTNQMIDLQSLAGQAGKELEEKVMLAEDNFSRLQLVSEFLEKRIPEQRSKEMAIPAAIKFIMETKGMVNIEQLASQYNLSIRQFERKFKELSGFSPKFFSRIIRFQAATNEYTNKGKSLTEIAYEYGYYDQSHFIHEFKEFSGYHPKHYFSGNAEGTEFRES